MERYRRRLPDNLCKKGVFLDFLGIWEYAWKYQDVMSVIEYVAKNEMVILGGDVYKLTKESVEILDDSWYLIPTPHVTSKESIKRAKKYIGDYYARNGEQYIYSLVIQ